MLVDNFSASNASTNQTCKTLGGIINEMNYKEFKDRVQYQINKLTDQKCIEFGLLICNRLLPEYQKFYALNNWGDTEKLKEAIKFCESIKSNKIIDQNILADLIKQVESIIPDTEDFGDYSSSYAINSSASVLELLEYFVDKDKSTLTSASLSVMDLSLSLTCAFVLINLQFLVKSTSQPSLFF